MKFGDVLNCYLTELGMTARDVARRSGLSEQYVSQIRKGVDPSFTRGIAIIDALGVGIDEFEAKIKS